MSNTLLLLGAGTSGAGTPADALRDSDNEVLTDSDAQILTEPAS